MRKAIIPIMIPFLLVSGISQIKAQTTSASNNLVAQPVPDRTVSYSVLGTGVAKPVTFGLDLAWLSEANIRRGIAFMGKPQVRLIRSSFTPTDSLINGELKPNEMSILNQRLNIIQTWMGPTTIALNDDNPSVSSWYKNADGSFNAARWAQLIDVTTRHHQDQGHNVITVGPFNEPDYSNGQGSMQDFYNIAGELKSNPRFSNIRISGGNTLNCDQALPWYNFLKTRLDEGNTHQLAGGFDNFASFYQTVRANGHHASGDELHNVMEAMVGAEYGMQTGIWWGTAELARGEFVKASDGVRLGYAEHRPNWTAASVYRGTDGKVKAFGGTSERQAATTTYRFLSNDKDVYYDGYGPQREYTMVMPGGTGYQQGQTNAERVVNITWGDDIQPVINGRYVLVNRNSGKVLEVAGGSTNIGVNLQQGTYMGSTYQQWNVTPVSSRIGGDFSYFTFTSVNSGKSPDILNFSLDNGTNIIVWDDVKSANQQWYLDYAADGWFYIRSRHSAKCIDVLNAGTGDGANIVQWDNNGGTNQQWRFLPVDAPIEFVAPSAPGNPVATAHAESILLNWTASPDADVTGYTIFRSASSGGPYNTIARNVTSTSFVDNTTTTGGQFFYIVKAVDKSLNSSTYSNEVSATATGTNDLVTHLQFNGNTRDTSINLNHAASLGGISYGTGKVGPGSMVLNGTNAFLQLPATLANQQEITIATWVYWNGGGAWQRIFDFGNDQSQYMFLTPGSGSGTLRFAIKNGGAEQILDAPPLPAGVWTHVSVTLGASGASMYVNGNVVAQSNTINISPLDFKPVLNYIGRSQFPDPMLNGSVDEFKIFNYALSASEVLAQLTPTVLPLTWGSFIAEKRENKGLLKWTTFQEHNVAEFIVEKSIDGVHFSRIGAIKSAGESNVTKSYSLTDATPVEGANYYRIKQVDKDGHFTHSNVRTLSFEGLPTVITITPNPAREMISVTVPGNNKSLQAVLLNSAGQKVDAFTIKGQYTTYSLLQHAAGVYYLQIQGANVNISKKLVINR
ncbi:MAG: LamG-like jellyroll fold domain-containing protein [Ferruginibacter sp.]